MIYSKPNNNMGKYYFEYVNNEYCGQIKINKQKKFEKIVNMQKLPFGRKKYF
jgi:hypothetical protein